MNKIIAVANQKGGVGKTTTAISLTACIGVAERPTLLIDMDPQANATSGMGFNPRTIASSIYDVLLNKVPIQDVWQDTELEFVKIVPSNIDLVGAEIELVSELARETKLKHAVEAVRNEFEYIVIDCPPSLGLLTLNSLTAADSVLIPIQCEYFAMEGISRLVDTVDLVRRTLNKSLTIEGVLLTMYDGRLMLSRQVAKEIRSYFRDKVFQTIISRNVRLGEAPSFGKPVILYDAVSRGSENYMHLAEEILANGS